MRRILGRREGGFDLLLDFEVELGFLVGAVEGLRCCGWEGLGWMEEVVEGGGADIDGVGVGVGFEGGVGERVRVDVAFVVAVDRGCDGGPGGYFGC